jgi:hypothetical protein
MDADDTGYDGIPSYPFGPVGYDGIPSGYPLGRVRCNPENYDVSYYDKFDCDGPEVSLWIHPSIYSSLVFLRHRLFYWHLSCRASHTRHSFSSVPQSIVLLHSYLATVSSS